MTFASGNPRFLVSTLSSPVLPSAAFADVSSRLPLSGVDLDASSRLRTRLQNWRSLVESSSASVKSVWLPSDSIEVDQGSSVTSAALPFAPGAPITLIIDRPKHGGVDAMGSQIATAIGLRRSLDERFRVAISIRPHHINGTRAHLSTLSSVRMQASEWDMDLALDLSRELDWLWEAEAAVYRMMSSLRIVRLAFRSGTLDGRFRASLTERALASCAELGFDGMISLVTPLPWWHWRNQRTLEASCREAAGRVTKTFARAGMPIDFSTELSARVELE
jgi:hypothetical protein